MGGRAEVEIVLNKARTWANKRSHRHLLTSKFGSIVSEPVAPMLVQIRALGMSFRPKFERSHIWTSGPRFRPPANIAKVAAVMLHPI